MLIGHQRIIKHLSQSIKSGRLAHAYLFAGPAHLGKKTVAFNFISQLVGVNPEKGIYPDILIIEPKLVGRQGVKKEAAIAISQIKKLQRQVSLYPYRLAYKIILIDQAEKMTLQAANCLLKTLEEPVGRTVIILISSRPWQVLPTISSRCQLLNFLPASGKQIKQAVENLGIKLPGQTELDKLIRLANGRPGIVLEYLNNPALFREQEAAVKQLEDLLKADLNFRYELAEKMSKDILSAQSVLSQWMFWFRDLLLAKLDCREIVVNQSVFSHLGLYPIGRIKEIIEAINRTTNLLRNPSLNARLALEALMLEF